MSNVRIGPDGSIIKDDVVIEANDRTVIREDGTIETTSVAGYVRPPERAPMINVPPVSPLERNAERNSYFPPAFENDVPAPSDEQERAPLGRVDQKAIKEKEYDIQILDGRIKNAVPKSMIVLTILLCIVGAFGLYFLFIPAVITAIIVIVGFSKKSELEAQRARLYAELEELESGR